MIRSFTSLFTSGFYGHYVVILTTVAIILPQTYQQIVINVQGNAMKWDDCLYRKVRITEDNETSCYKCSVNESMPFIPASKTDWSQEFINCSEFCDHSTICTKAKYYSLKDTPPVERPLCFQCENRKTEVVWFESKYHHELCPQDCKRCADMVDLSDAVKCAPICKGYPTFCFPMRLVLGEKLCYQASFWYGCDYMPVFPNTTSAGPEEKGELTENCQKCALGAGKPEHARYCAYACSHHPTYYNGSTFLQCRPHAVVEDKNNDLFLYNIPNEILSYLQVSNSSYLYPTEIMDNKIKYLDGHIARQINKKFNVAKLNRPLPEKHRNRIFVHEVMDIVKADQKG